MDKKNRQGKHRKKNRLAKWFSDQKRWKKITMVVVPILVLLLVAAGIFVFAKLSGIQKETIDPKELSIVDVDGYTNILFLGVDTRDINDLKDCRSDAIMVISINEETKDVKLISVYRDTFLKMGDEDRYDKIAHAFAYGGAPLSVKSINQALDLNIQNYVVFNFKAVADLIDKIGGIEVDVKEEEIFALNDYAQETADIIGRKECPMVTEPGKQTLVGVQAVSYGRIRKGVGDDFKRTERMRNVLTIAADKIKNLNVSQISELIDLITPQIKTTLSNSDIISLGLDIGNYKINGSVGFPYEKDSDMLDGVSYVYSVNLEQDVIKLHQEVFGQKNYKISMLCKQISDHILNVFGTNYNTNDIVQQQQEETFNNQNGDNQGQSQEQSQEQQQGGGQEPEQGGGTQ